MRVRSLVTFFAPLLSKAIVVPKDSSPLSIPAPDLTQASNHFEYTPLANGGALTFDVGRQGDDDNSLHFSFQVTRPVEITSCDDLEIRVNGLVLPQTWIYDRFGHVSSPTRRTTIVAERGSNHPALSSVTLQSSTVCVLYDSSPEEKRSVKVITFQVVAVDDQPAIGSLPTFTTTFVASPNSLDGDLSYPTVPESKSIPEPNRVVQSDRLENLNIEDEIARLYQLDEEFRDIESLLQGQKALVNNLSKANALGTPAELSGCNGVKCMFETLFLKLRHMLIQLQYKLKSGLEHKHSTMEEETCVHADSPMAQADVLMSNRRLCSNATVVPTTAFSSTERIASSSVLSPLTCRSRSRLLLTTLDIVTISFCLISLAVYCRARCTDPRRRAERASRREERRTRRAYRCLARKQALKNWWNRGLLRRNSDPRIQDYEEKRELIIAQEAILENAMQHEIRQLREAEGLTSETESEHSRGEPSTNARLSRTRTYSRPPTYRSRASSGRPPSYNEADTVVRGVANGFHGYSPSGTTMTPAGTDRTPDSSVMSLSPRHSSETLRTELSVL